jgi:hypothetical protein
MAKKQPKSEFHKAIQGEAYDTLRNQTTRKAIEEAARVFSVEFPLKPWESLVALRDHVHALIGAYRDMDFARRQAVLDSVSSGKYKSDPRGGLAALSDLDRDPYTLADIHAEIDRQGIPEL